MSWSIIAAAEVLAEFTPQEQASIAAIQGANTNLTGVLVRVVNAWRGAISRNQELGATNTIPADVREDVIAEARWRWLVSLPSLKALQTKERNDLYKDALAHLKEIRAGELVESATDTAATKNASDYSADTRKATATKLDGLV